MNKKRLADNLLKENVHKYAYLLGDYKNYAFHVLEIVLCSKRKYSQA